MSRRVVGAVVVLLVAATTGGVLFVGGLGPGESPSSPTDESPADSTGTTTADATTEETAASGGTGETGGGNNTTTGTTTETSDSSAYRFTIQSIEKCGTTCRDVTARLANAGADERTNVRVTTKLYADGDLLWSGTETVGALAPGEAHTSTKRVDVGLSGGMKIQNNDGYVTIVTVVRSDSGTTRFSERRKVA